MVEYFLSIKIISANFFFLANISAKFDKPPLLSSFLGTLIIVSLGKSSVRNKLNPIKWMKELCQKKSALVYHLL